MGKNKLRKIVVDGLEYAWRFSPAYWRLEVPWLEYRCFDTLLAYRWGYPTSPVRIHFVTWECASAGGPLRTGLPLVLGKPETAGVNLHMPSWAAALIRKALERGWEPSAVGKPFVIENGLEILAELGCLSIADARAHGLKPAANGEAMIAANLPYLLREWRNRKLVVGFDDGDRYPVSALDVCRLADEGGPAEIYVRIEDCLVPSQAYARAKADGPTKKQPNIWWTSSRPQQPVARTYSPEEVRRIFDDGGGYTLYEKEPMA